MSSIRIIGSIALLITAMTSSFCVHAEGPLVMINTSKGDIVLELNDDEAPQSVENFLQYVDDGFYENTVFHRVIEGFMIQGGGFTQNYERKKTRPPVNNEAYNGLPNRQYTIAMARTTAPHSATSQFFINSETNRNLDHTDTTQRGWGYTVFGKVIDGIDIVDAISQVRTGPGGPFGRDVPAEPVVILKATRVVDIAHAAVTTADDAAAKPLGSDTDDENVTTNLAPTDKAKANQSQPVEQN